MTRTSRDQYINGRLINGFDYINQAWVIDGQYDSCAHPPDMHCDCYGRQHAGEETKAGRLDGSEPTRDIEEGIDIDWPPAGPRF